MYVCSLCMYVCTKGDSVCLFFPLSDGHCLFYICIGRL